MAGKPGEVKKAVEQLEKPFRGSNNRTMKQFATFFAMAAGMAEVMANASASQKKYVKQLTSSLQDRATDAEIEDVKKKTPEAVKKKTPEAVKKEQRDLGFGSYNKKQFEETKKESNYLKNIKEHLGLLYGEYTKWNDTLTKTLFGPLSTYLGISKSFIVKQIKTKYEENKLRKLELKKLKHEKAHDDIEEKRRKYYEDLTVEYLKQQVDSFGDTETEESNFYKEQLAKQEQLIFEQRRQEEVMNGFADFAHRNGLKLEKDAKKSLDYEKSIEKTTKENGIMGMLSGIISGIMNNLPLIGALAGLLIAIDNAIKFFRDGEYATRLMDWISKPIMGMLALFTKGIFTALNLVLDKFGKHLETDYDKLYAMLHDPMTVQAADKLKQEKKDSVQAESDLAKWRENFRNGNTNQKGMSFTEEELNKLRKHSAVATNGILDYLNPEGTAISDLGGVIVDAISDGLKPLEDHTFVNNAVAKGLSSLGINSTTNNVVGGGNGGTNTTTANVEKLTIKP